MLFDPDQHEPLVEIPWDEARVRQAVAAIVGDAEANAGDAAWPLHPRDEWPAFPPGPTTLYQGAAGMAWALHRLGSSLDPGSIVDRALARYRARPDFAPRFGDEPSLWMGESGLLLVARIVGSAAADDARLRERIHENRANPTWELMWGSPGTTLAARAAGFDDLWRESGELLEGAWAPDGLWTQDLYGTREQGLGPPHGLAGNVHALRGFLPDDELRARVAAPLERTALRSGALANWPPAVGSEARELRLQWCHGAPGIVATIGDLMPCELALAGGELTWQAGPLAKGPTLCHGTAGSGYAFLRLYAVTGDELWLDRARRFAMHAIAQVEHEREAVGRGRYTLWTGDVGVALYLRSCLERSAALPTIDYW